MCTTCWDKSVFISEMLHLTFDLLLWVGDNVIFMLCRGREDAFTYLKH